eukprot:2993548-Rhodomonas_salina.2
MDVHPRARTPAIPRYRGEVHGVGSGLTTVSALVGSELTAATSTCRHELAYGQSRTRGLNTDETPVSFVDHDSSFWCRVPAAGAEQ